MTNALHLECKHKGGRQRGGCYRACPCIEIIEETEMINPSRPGNETGVYRSIVELKRLKISQHQIARRGNRIELRDRPVRPPDLPQCAILKITIDAAAIAS